jgi:hypothetical protein
MLSNSEIKKEGWKPTQHSREGIGPHFTLKRHGKDFELEVDKIQQMVAIFEIVENEMTGKLPFHIVRFNGHIPKRYELRIIMRCLGIG